MVIATSWTYPRRTGLRGPRSRGSRSDLTARGSSAGRSWLRAASARLMPNATTGTPGPGTYASARGARTSAVTFGRTLEQLPAAPRLGVYAGKATTTAPRGEAL